ncbi:MAG: DNA-directed RNA polymerase subunit A' [Candidatus Micrarchaeales archaeon]|jgi:DNA-directed RNA polymerase subunit A'
MQAESIEYIKFGVLSPEQIRKLSVAKLTVPDTYNEDGYPIDGGLLDQRLGVIDPGLVCKTCGAKAKACPGHFGHIELVRPVIHSEFARIIYMLLQSTCQECGRVLLSQEQINDLREIIKTVVVSEGEEEVETDKLNEKNQLLKKLRSIKKCPHCGAVQEKIKFEPPTYFYIGDRRLKPDEIRERLSKISDDDLRLLGIDPETSRPEWLVLTNLLVPPVNVRPSITLESGERSEDDLTHKLVDIMRINQRLEQNINAGAPQIIIDDLWELLQYNVTTYFNNEAPGIPPARHRSGRALKTLAQRLKGKEGRFRYNLSGKRVNFSARTVISVDPYIDIDEVGVPYEVAKKLTVPFYVTEWNIEKAREWLSRSEYPMVVGIITKDGKRKRIVEGAREEIIKSISPGDILERQLVDGDIVIFNRQPSLHRINIMAHKVRVLPGRTFRLNYDTTHPYGADFDGDEMNLHVPQTLEAQAEAKYLMWVSNQVFSPRTGDAIITNNEDGITGAYLLTKDSTRLTKKEASELLALAGIYELPKPGKDGMYAGKDVFSLLFPSTFNFEQKLKDQTIKIVNGKLVEGVLNKSTYGRGSKLLAKLGADFGMEAVRDFLNKSSRLVDAFVTKMGITVGIKEYLVNREVEEERKAIIERTFKKINELIESYKNRKLEPLVGYTLRQSLERMIISELDLARESAGQYVATHSEEDNDVILMAFAGSRGSILQVVQMEMFLGQQATQSGGRIKRGYSTNRVLPHIQPNDISPPARGFVTTNYFYGLSPIDFYMHAIGSRGSEVYKALLTARSGYLYRRVSNALQDYYVEYDLSVRDVHGRLLQTIYGGDGIDPIKERINEMKASD